MKVFLQISEGILGFFILYWVDFFDLKEKKKLKISTWIIGITLLLSAHIQVILNGEKYVFPEIFKILGIIFSLIFIGLLFYSVFIEIPLLKKKGFALNDRGLVVAGTYSLSRHPGILWYIFALIFLFLATGSKLFLIAIPVWGLMDIIYAIMQDKILFPRLFGEDYNYYKIKTNMFIPDINGLKSCFYTYRKIFHSDSGNTPYSISKKISIYK